MPRTHPPSSPPSRRAHRRRLGAVMGAALGLTAFGAASPSTLAAPSDPVVDTASGWRYIKDSIDTGQGFGFQLALDPVSRKVYLSDMATGSHRYDTNTEVFSYADKSWTGFNGEPGGQVIVIDAATRTVVDNHDFTTLSRVDGSGPANTHPALSFFGTANEAGVRSYGALRNDWGAYGVDVDPFTYYDGVLDPTIVTTQARQRLADAPVLDNDGNVIAGQTRSYGGGLVIYRASQGGPTDADVINAFDDGAPILQGPRRVAINTETHMAYITSLGTQRNNGPQPGFLTEVDLLTKTVTARIALPAEGTGESAILPGTVGVAVDEANNLIYAGAFGGTGLYVIDGDEIDRSNPRSVNLNADAITKLPAVLDGNQRPTYSPSDQRLYISQYDAQKVSIVDANPTSATYGHELHEITGVDTNSTLVDGERGLLFSADLKDANVKVYDTTTFEQVLTLPTSGQALNMAIDPGTGDLWVSNWGGFGWSAEHTPKVDVFSIDQVEKHTKTDGATYYVPTTWTEGQPLVVTGTGWLTRPMGDTPPFPADYTQSGSAIAVKLSSAGDWISPTAPIAFEPPYNTPGDPDTVWALIEADVDGTFTASIPYPAAALTSTPAAVGASIELFFLTGSVKPFDTPRGGPAGAPPAGNPIVTIVEAGSAVTPPHELTVVAPLAPSRYWDTRDEPTFDGEFSNTGRLAAGANYRIEIAGRGGAAGVPADAVGVVANLTVISPDAPGFATVHPCTEGEPTTSTVNYLATEVLANNVIVPLDDGDLCVFTLAGADFALDINGYVTADSPQVGITPTRFADTRETGSPLPAGGVLTVDITGSDLVPDDAQAAIVNITAVTPAADGYLTAYPCDAAEVPHASTVNYLAGQYVPNGAVVDLSADGELCVFTLSEVDVLVDVTGYVPAGVDTITPLTPARLFDSRPGEELVDGIAAGPRLTAGRWVEVQVEGRHNIPATATAAFFNVAVIVPDGPGFVALAPNGGGDAPSSSNLNHATGGVIRANNAVTQLSDDGTVWIYTLSGADIILDVTGYVE